MVGSDRGGRLPMWSAGLARLLPHRGAMLLLDAVLRREAGWLEGIVDVRWSSLWVGGRVGDDAVMPGVLQLEALGQLGAVEAMLQLGLSAPEVQLRLLDVDKARFFAPVRPDCRLTVRSRVLRRSGPFWRFSGEGWVARQQVCAAEVTLWVERRAASPEE